MGTSRSFEDLASVDSDRLHSFVAILPAFALALIAAIETASFAFWGVVWPWRHLATFPGDGGANLYVIWATILLLGVNFCTAAVLWRRIKVTPLLTAVVLAPPLAVAVLVGLLSFAPLDAVVFYLALIPAAFTVSIPYLVLLQIHCTWRGV